MPEEPHQPAHGRGIVRELEQKSLRRRTCASEKIAQPAKAIPGQYGNHCVATPPKLLGETKYHHLRPAWSVGVEHHRDAEVFVRPRHATAVQSPGSSLAATASLGRVVRVPRRHVAAL